MIQLIFKQGEGCFSTGNCFSLSVLGHEVGHVFLVVLYY